MTDHDEPEAVDFAEATAPFATEIGLLTFSWNMLQETLGDLFATVTNRDNFSVGRAIWHSAKNDRAQRDMLQAAYMVTRELSSLPSAKDDIRWLIEQVNKYADKRNNAIHAPISVLFSLQLRTFSVEPWIMGNNPRAKKLGELKGTSLLDELRWYREVAEVLRKYAVALYVHVYCQNTDTWPERPRIPSRKASRETAEN